jgi:hypothetical protein
MLLRHRTVRYSALSCLVRRMLHVACGLYLDHLRSETEEPPERDRYLKNKLKGFMIIICNSILEGNFVLNPFNSS